MNTYHTNNQNTTNFNRCRIEWMKVLSPTEYMILDYMLYRLNLEQSNDGKGWVFHVRDIINQTGVSPATVCKILNAFPFVIKRGTNRNMNITIDKTLLEKWDRFKIDTKTVSKVDGNCFKNETVTVSKMKHRSTNKEVVQRSTNNIESIVQAQQAGILKGETIQSSKSIEATERPAASLSQPEAVASSDSSSQSGRQAVSNVVPVEIDGFAQMLKEQLKNCDFIRGPKEDDGSADGSINYTKGSVDAQTRKEIDVIKKTREQADYLVRVNLQNKGLAEWETVFGVNA